MIGREETTQLLPPTLPLVSTMNGQVSAGRHCEQGPAAADRRRDGAGNGPGWTALIPADGLGHEGKLGAV
jgi:hypothetical protein